MFDVFEELVSKQRYTVACPVKAHGGIAIDAEMTVMFCVCFLVATVDDPMGIPAWSNIVIFKFDHGYGQFALFIVSVIVMVDDRCMLLSIWTSSMPLR
jgi:hypothetical protein